MKQSSYYSFKEWKRVVRKMGITSPGDYRKRRKGDPRLPIRPDLAYKSFWKEKGGWGNFLLPKKYPTYVEAFLAVRRLGITSGVEYKARYKEDPLLPSAPDKYYPSEWRGWGRFCRYTYHEAMAIAQKEGVKNAQQYRELARKNQSLPSAPDMFYSEYWIDLSSFLGVKIASQ